MGHIVAHYGKACYTFGGGRLAGVMPHFRPELWSAFLPNTMGRANSWHDIPQQCPFMFEMILMSPYLFCYVWKFAPIVCTSGSEGDGAEGAGAPNT